jgi:preprotein translocase subunit SecY
MVAGSIMFAVFWVKTSGMDASSQAEQISGSGLQVSGFRRDPRVIESILSRYIMPLTIMGGAAVGLLASLADITGALVRGTGILLSVMILYKMYEDVAQQHQMDSNPLARKFIGS